MWGKYVVYGFLLLITSYFNLIVLLVFVYDFILMVFVVWSWCYSLCGSLFYLGVLMVLFYFVGFYS